MYNRNIQKWADGLAHHDRLYTYNFEILVEVCVFIVLRYVLKIKASVSCHLTKAVLNWMSRYNVNQSIRLSHAFTMHIVVLVLAVMV